MYNIQLCSSGVEAVPQRDSPGCQEQSSANPQTLCQWVLVRAQQNKPESSNDREHQRDMMAPTSEGLFRILPKIGCPPKLQSLIESFHSNVQFNGSSMEPFNMCSGVKQGCVLVQTQDLLYHASEACIWHIRRRNLSAYEIRWCTFESFPPQSQDQSTQSTYQRHAVCWQCGTSNPHPAGTSVTDGPLLPGL